MKKSTLFIAALCIYSFSFSQKNVSSTIENVTVFMRGAELFHMATEKIPKGKSQIVFTSLSPDLDPNSVVVNVGSPAVSILSVSSRSNYLKPVEDNDRIAIVKDSMAFLSDEIQKNTDLLKTLEREKDILFKNEAIGGTSQGVSIGEIEKAADFYRGRHNEINGLIFNLNKRLSSLNKRLTVSLLQLAELNAQYNSPSSEITLEVSSPTEVTTSFNFSYIVSKAGWSPKYDVRTEKLGDPIRLVYRANVFNNCGTDWNEVKMKLSTADPLRGADKPKLETWNIDKMAGIELNAVLISSSSEAVFKSNGSGYFPNESGDVFFENIEVQELTSEFEIPVAYSILSDSKPYTVDVTSYNLPAVYEHYAVPSMEKDAYLTAKFTGWNNLNLVSGEASIFFKGTYLGQSFINTVSVDDTLAISLGRDKNIAIERKKMVDISKRQVLGNNEKETSFFETTLRNNSDKEVILMLEDQVPVSSRGDITVDVLEMSEGVLDKPTGKIQWRIRLAPGESRKISFGYSVKTPKGMVVGGKRSSKSTPRFL